ncbi:MAG: GntR family transcriptional regulator, partial [Bacteroidota bacterium]
MSVVIIDTHSKVPKYKQIINSIEEAIASEQLKIGDKVPSLNSIKDQHALSRDTVLLAFNDLRTRGIIQSVVGKGYYVASTNIELNEKVFLLFDELNSFKEDLYYSFLDHLGDKIQVDIFFHHFNPAVFKQLIQSNLGQYTYYVIMPANLEDVIGSIERLPREKVFILDQTTPELGAFASVYQNFSGNVYEGLKKSLTLIRKYKNITIVFSRKTQPRGILQGLQEFCEEFGVSYTVENTFKEEKFEPGELYFLLDERSLIQVIKKIKEVGLIIGKEVG